MVLLGLRFHVPLSPPQPADVARPVATAGAMRVLDLRVTTGATVRAPDRTLPATVSPDVPAPAMIRAVHPLPPRAADPRPLRDRTVPRATDARLWRHFSEPTPPVDEVEAARAPIALATRILNDSITGAAEARRSAADWTLVGESGARWGAAADTIVLGRRKLALRSCSAGPCDGWWLESPPGRREEFAARRRGFDEIRLQAARAELVQSIDARIRAIRARRISRPDSLSGPLPL